MNEAVFAFSQIPYQIVDTTKDWNTMSIGVWSWGIHHCGGTKTNKFEEEIIFGEQTFLKVFESEDSLQEMGDSVFIDNYYTSYTSTLICESIDSIYLNRGFRNRYHFSAVYRNRENVESNDIVEIWIEGIGSDYQGEYYLEIFNYEGKLTDKKTLTSGSSIIESRHYKNGIYLFKITDDKQKILKIEKIIKK